MLHIAFFFSAFTWVAQHSNSDASLRGLHVVSQKVSWASGTHGTYLITLDGGQHWSGNIVPGGDRLDFRDVEAFDRHTAFLLASGPGGASRLYGTRDGGRHWREVFANPDAAGFFDSVKFWDKRNGIILGDPVGGQFAIFTTKDGGVSWQRRKIPAALPGEGAFAASGTCVSVLKGPAGALYAWFATGGPGAGRVFRTANGGESWAVSSTPLSGFTNSSGIFSLAFRDLRHGIAVGGDYQKPLERARTLALTDDGGETWRTPAASGLSGYRSAVTFVAGHMALAVGTSGADFSADDGETWKSAGDAGFNAVAASGGTAWGVGAKGAIAKLIIPSR